MNYDTKPDIQITNHTSSDNKSQFMINRLSNVKKIIGIAGIKGGVGKSTITSLLAAALQKQGVQTAILDTDFIGSAIPKMLGINKKTPEYEDYILPVSSKSGIKVMSASFLLDNESKPITWSGSVAAGIVKQFWTNVIWGDVDYMFVDLPSGIGDVTLAAFKAIPLDGIIIVTSPQELVSSAANKTVRFVESMHIPVVGLIENMAYFECPTCNDRHYIFGYGHMHDLEKLQESITTAKIPISEKLAFACDMGNIELFYEDWLLDILDIVCLK